jgi:hypothetical protein
VNKPLDLSRALVLAIGLTTAAVSLSAPAHADPIDDSFLAALSGAGMPFDNPADTAALGRNVCPMLVEPGKNLAKVYSQVTDNGVPPDMAAFFTGIAISMYCPQAMSSIGNGTFLDWLPAGGFGGLPGI